MNKFRNTLPFGDIEEQSLWEKKGENFILVDDDDFEMLPVKCWEHCFTPADKGGRA